MDGVSQSSSAAADMADEDASVQKRVTVIAASNRPQDLDEAIRRRLEKRVYIPLPSEKGREKLFNICLKDEILAQDIEIKELVKKSEGYSGADIHNVCRDAAMISMRKVFMNIDYSNPSQ